MWRGLRKAQEKPNNLESFSLFVSFHLHRCVKKFWASAVWNGLIWDRLVDFSWPEPTCKVRWSDRFLASEQLAPDQKAVLFNCIAEPRQLHVQISRHMLSHTTSCHGGLAQWPQTPPWGMLFQSSTTLALQDVLSLRSQGGTACNDMLQSV